MFTNNSSQRLYPIGELPRNYRSPSITSSASSTFQWYPGVGWKVQPSIGFGENAETFAVGCKQRDKYAVFRRTGELFWGN